MRNFSKALLLISAAGAMLVTPAVAAQRFQPKLLAAKGPALKDRVKVRPVVQRPTSGRPSSQTSNRPKPADTVVSRPSTPDVPPKRPDRPNRPDNAGPIKPPKIVLPPIRVACNGGRIVRGQCVCPVIGRARAQPNGTNCGPVVGVPLPPRVPVVTVPLPPAAGVSTFVPLPPLRDASPPVLPPSLPPPRVTSPLPPSPFVPSVTLADQTQVPDEVIFALPSDAPEATEEGVAQRFNLTLLERAILPLVGQRIVRLRIPDNRLVPAVVAQLQQDGAVIGPQPNFLYRPQQAIGSAVGPEGLQYALAKVDLSAAHRIATGKGAVVGIIDTGVDVAHNDLKDSDIATFDAAGGDGAPDTHGTAIAGIISAKGLTRGIAPSARVVSARAFNARAGGAPQLTTSFILLKAIDWAIGEKARVLNLSFAGPEDPMLRKAVGAADQRGVILVAAAGNNGRNAPAVYPAAYDNVIAATAVDADDKLYAKANVGAYVAIAAPGVDVLAPSACGAHDLQSGTSFAAAHVTGVVALMLERDPGLPAREVRAALAAGAQDLGKLGPDEEFGAGRVNAAAALQAIAGRARN